MGGGGHRGDSDEQARTPDTPSALVRVSSSKNGNNKPVMGRVREETSLSSLSSRSVSLSDTAAFSTANDSLQEAGRS